jgi:hypothetical protein
MAIPPNSVQEKKYDIPFDTIAYERSYAVKMEQSVEDAYKARMDILKYLNEPEKPASEMVISPTSRKEEILRILDL